MDGNQIVKAATDKFAMSESHFNDEVSKLRTGRAHPSMLDGVMVEAYETKMPLIQVGSITVPEATTLQITPFDPTNIEAISSAIRADQQLGLNPSDDGRVVRVPVPPLTTERRGQIVKVVKEKMEDAFISMRNARHDGNKQIKAGDFNSDEAKSLEANIDEAMAKVKKSIEATGKAKEEDILKV